MYLAEGKITEGTCVHVHITWKEPNNIVDKGHDVRGLPDRSANGEFEIHEHFFPLGRKQNLVAVDFLDGLQHLRVNLSQKHIINFQGRSYKPVSTSLRVVVEARVTSNTEQAHQDLDPGFALEVSHTEWCHAAIYGTRPGSWDRILQSVIMTHQTIRRLNIIAHTQLTTISSCLGEKLNPRIV